MAITTFIPEIWSARLLENLQDNLVAAHFANRYYDGDIRRAGDTVHIGSLGAINVSAYTANTNMDDPQVLTTTDQTLLIDQAKSFNFTLDDVDRAQAGGDLMEAAMGQAAYALAKMADTYIFSTIKTAVTAMDTVALTVDNVYTSLLGMKKQLDVSNVPLEGRALAISPAVHALLLQDDRFVASGSSAADENLKKGLIGQVAGFTLYLTNNLIHSTSNDVTTTYLLAGHPMACAYAEQISQVEAYRLEKRFADAVKGLHLYGVKVLHADALALLPVTVA